MKYELYPPFHGDYKRLSEEEWRLFRAAVEELNRAYARHTGPGIPRWPRSLRIKPVASAPGIWELTWSFASPDGRATFEFITIEGELAIRWRRIGGHRIFEEP